MKRKPARKKKALLLVGVLAAAFVVYVLVLPLNAETSMTEDEARPIAQAYYDRTSSSHWPAFSDKDVQIAACIPEHTLGGGVRSYEFLLRTADGEDAGSISVFENGDAGGDPNGPDFNYLSQKCAGRDVTPQDYVYSHAETPFLFAMRNGDGTYSVMLNDSWGGTLSNFSFWFLSKLWWAFECPARAVRSL